MPDPKRVSTRWNLRGERTRYVDAIFTKLKFSDVALKFLEVSGSFRRCFQLSHVPARHLDDAVVQGRLETCCRGSGHAVSDTDEILAQGELSSNIS